MSWYVFFGHRLGMSREETLVTTIGEMTDLINCMEIYSGRAMPKRRKMTYDEAIMLR